MEEKTPKKQRITNQQFKQMLFDNLNAGEKRAHFATNFYQLLQTNFQISIDKTRALALHGKHYGHWCELNQTATAKELAAQTQAATRCNLETRADMIAFYEAEINRMDRQLRGDLPFTFIVNGRLMHSHNKDVFVCPIQVQNDLRRTVLTYTSEINKLAGSYAPTKIAQTDSAGVDIDTSLLTQTERQNLVLVAAKIFGAN